MTSPEQRPRVEGERVALLIALEELKRWPDIPGIHFYCYDPDGGKTALQSQKVEHIFDALHRHAVTLWRSEREAVEAWNAMPALRAENARLTAEVERLREIADDALLQAEMFDEHDPTVQSIRARLAALALPTPAPEATNDGK